MAAASKTPSPHRLRRPLLLLVLLAAGVWFTLFDSHSLLDRLRWHHEADRLQAENAVLQQEIDGLEERLSRPISDEVIEQIAREQYGMRRPGETIYRVEDDASHD